MIWIIIGIVAFIVLIIIIKRIIKNNDEDDIFDYEDNPKRSFLRKFIDACCLHR